MRIDRLTGVCTALAIILSGCGGSGDNNTPPVDQPRAKVAIPGLADTANFSFDLGTVVNGKYYVTDRNNKAVDVVDVNTLDVKQIKGTGANAFAGSTWLVRAAERDAMFAEKPAGIIEQGTFSALKTAKTTILDKDDYNVFGDGTVVIKSAPGHTPGHQVLFLKLRKTGPLLVAGDLYHYPEERTMNRFPSFEFNKEQSAASRANIDAFLKKTKAQMWISHDAATNATLKKAPAYYD